MNSTELAGDLLADRFAPHHDVMQTRHLVADAPVAEAYAALRGLDFIEVGGGLVNAAFWVRGLPERWHSRHHKPPRTPTRLTLEDMVAGSDWVILGERPGVEIAAGVVGRFWKPVIEWRPVESAEFADFAEPGYGKIVMSLSTHPYGATRSLLNYDVRVTLTDSPSRRKFHAYWMMIAPFVGAIQMATLRLAARNARNPG